MPKIVRVPPHGLEGLLRLPETARGLVIFAHGSGSSRLSPRNRVVAEALADEGMASLLFDPLSEEEARDRANVFDIELLAARLLQAISWARTLAATRGLRIGLFGASTGAAAALVAAARARDVAAIVSRGGRPDLGRPALRFVRAPTLLIVGGLDRDVLALNRQALEELGGEKDLQIVPGATHLFEEPGALETVIAFSRRWFARHLVPQASETIR